MHVTGKGLQLQYDWMPCLKWVVGYKGQETNKNHGNKKTYSMYMLQGNCGTMHTFSILRTTKETKSYVECCQT
jgi:hypothetical protein